MIYTHIYRQIQDSAKDTPALNRRVLGFKPVFLVKRDQPVINQFILPTPDHDTAAHIQPGEVTPDEIQAPRPGDHLAVFQRERIRKRRVAEVKAQHGFTVPRKAVLDIDGEMPAVENAVSSLPSVSVPDQDLDQDVVDLGAVLLRVVFEAAAFEGDGCSGYRVPVRGNPGKVAGGITAEPEVKMQ